MIEVVRKLLYLSIMPTTLRANQLVFIVAISVLKQLVNDGRTTISNLKIAQSKLVLNAPRQKARGNEEGACVRDLARRMINIFFIVYRI